MKNQPLKIVVANDEESPLKTVAVMLQACVTNARVLSFQDSMAAWETLSVEDPDLLITDDAMPGLRGREICERLLARKARFPIIVNSPWPPTEQWVRDCASRGLNVHFLPCPFDNNEFQEILERSLKMPSGHSDDSKEDSVSKADKTPVFDPALWGQTKEQVEKMEGKFLKRKEKMNPKTTEQSAEAVDSSTLYRMVAPGKFAPVKKQPATAKLPKLLWHPKTIVAIAAVAFCLMGLFPPWIRTFNITGTHSQHDAGYSFVFFPPPAKPDVFDEIVAGHVQNLNGTRGPNSLYYGIQIDTSRLVIEWFCVLMVTGASLFILRGTTSKPHESKVV